jgi:hypothetical protein
MNDKQWRDKLRARFADHRRPEPPGLWEAVESRMAVERSTAARPLSGGVFRWGRRIGAAAAVAALVFVAGRIALRTDRPETETTTAGAIATTQPGPDAQTTEPKSMDPAHQTTPAPAIKHDRPSRPDPASRTVASNTHHVAAAPERAITDDGAGSFAGHPAEPAEITETAQPAPPATTETGGQTTPEQPRPAANGYGNADPFALTEPAKPRRRAWSARLVASRLPGSGSKMVHGGYGTFAAASPQSDAPMIEYATLGKDAMSDVMILNNNAKTYTETRHNPPVRAGVMVSRGLTDRLGIESGLTYARLGSRLKSGTERSFYETRRSLHYVGIPVNLNYSLWRNHLLRVYVSGGGMVEHNISGSASTEFTNEGRVFSRENERVRVEGLQWSANASVGLQVDVSRRVGVFVDPGLSYHFKNGSPVETVYKKNPLNFDLTFGLRFSFEK